MKFLLKGLCILVSISVTAQVHTKSWKQITESNDQKWYASEEAAQVAENVLLYQRNIGGWPKNIQMQQSLSDVDKQKLVELKSEPIECTIDNGATCQEMLFLSKIYSKNPDTRYKMAFLKGLNYLLTAQYDNGGWPQFYPLIKGYYTHITYNDDAMVNVLELFKELKNKTNVYSISPSPEILEKVNSAFNKGIDCILKTQYKQNGELTAWCAQHDEVSLLPAKARAYELPSLSGKESAKITLLLMSIENPSQEIIDAVEAAVRWFEKTKIEGIKIESISNPTSKKEDKVVVRSPNASPLWARFMDLDTNIPFFCDRDGIKKATLAEIGLERRSGYGWYTDEPKEVLKKYIYWKKNIARISSESSKKKALVKDDFYIVVDQTGQGNFLTIQDAINSAPSFPYQRIIIFVKNGVYKEKVKVHSWNPKISLIGESREGTIITYDDYFNKIGLGRNSTFYTYTMLVEGNDFFAKNLTIQNTSGEVGQAVALNVNADRVFFSNCSFIGNQDTLYTSGEGTKNYFNNCYIEGTTDFIFGDATVLFESCEIHSKKDSYVTAASTPQNTNFGYVFKDCKLTAVEGVSQVYLGRPWRIYAKTVFMNCEMGGHIKPEGWENWSKPEAEKSAFYAEYNCKGPGFQPQKRVSWSHQLTKKESEEYTSEAILGIEFINQIQSFK
ncbi:pectate lyase [Flavobacterium sp.]|uniref:pectate lyase n=1 Tax=Flavobacterium sp. TaxID=239 RepID=UPI0038F8119B